MCYPHSILIYLSYKIPLLKYYTPKKISWTPFLVCLCVFWVCFSLKKNRLAPFKGGCCGYHHSSPHNFRRKLRAPRRLLWTWNGYHHAGEDLEETKKTVGRKWWGEWWQPEIPRPTTGNGCINLVNHGTTHIKKLVQDFLYQQYWGLIWGTMVFNNPRIRPYKALCWSFPSYHFAKWAPADRHNWSYL